MIFISTPSELAPYSGQSLIEKMSIDIGSTQLEQFLAFSVDTNPIHMVGGSSQPVVPANLLISIIPSILQSHINFANEIQCFTVGYRDVQFKKQIRLEDEVLLSIKLKKVRVISDGAYVDYEFLFEQKDDNSVAAKGTMSDFCISKPPCIHST